MADEDNAPAPDAGEIPTAPEVPESEQGGVTEEEIKNTLHNAGIDLPDEPKAADDSEEGDDPDEDKKPTIEEDDAEGGEPEQPAENDEPADDADAKKPEAKPSEDAPTGEKEYSFEVKDKDGTTFKIVAGDSLEDILADFEPKNNGQIIDILNQLRKLEDQQTADQAITEAEAAEAETAKAVEQIQEGWNQERKELNITDDARYDEVMKYMSQENDKRQENGKPLIRTVEHALLGLEKQEAAKAAEDKVKTDKDDARKKGSLVGGASAPASPEAKVYQAGSARNSNEAIRAMGLL